jgi:alpha-1,2-mannosyltransferase
MPGEQAILRPEPARQALTHGLAIWAFVAPVWVLVNAALGGRFALDFRHAFLPAAHAVAHGASPYSSMGSRAVAEGTAFLYPPLSAYLLTPFILLPPLAAEFVAVGLVAAAVAGALWLIGVRDWRCFSLAFLWWPTIIGIQTANLTLPIVFGLAVLWRYRDRREIAAILTGLIVSLKLLFWPLLIWLIASRRYRSAAIAAAAAALLVVVPWAAIGFAGLRGYPHLLASISRTEGPRSYSVAALLHEVVPSWTAATTIGTVLGGGVLTLVLVAGRRGRERDAFVLSIIAVLMLTPLLEMHYLAVLIVVVGLYRQRFGLAWVAPLLIWGAPATVSGSAAQVAHVLFVVAATIALAVGDGRNFVQRAVNASRQRFRPRSAPIAH